MRWCARPSEGKRQEGITFLLIDLDLPGHHHPPIIGNGGDHEFNEVFFDNVRVPKAGRVGEENKGWEVAKYLLEFERGGNVMAGRVRAQFARVARLIAQRCPDDPEVAAAPRGAWDRHRRHGDDRPLGALRPSGGGQSGPDLLAPEVALERDPPNGRELAMDAAGEDALRWVDERPLYEALQLPPDEEETLALIPRYLNGRAFTIMGGTTEIQTNILAKWLLSL